MSRGKKPERHNAARLLLWHAISAETLRQLRRLEHGVLRRPLLGVRRRAALRKGVTAFYFFTGCCVKMATVCPPLPALPWDVVITSLLSGLTAAPTA